MGITVTRKQRPHGDCPTEEFERGLPRGNCEGDGHYLCPSCKHYKEPDDDLFPEMIFEMGIKVSVSEGGIINQRTATINPEAKKE
jgi:hypothetical protein